VSDDDGPTKPQIRQRSLCQIVAPRGSVFNKESDAVRQEPAPLREWQRHPVADDLDDQSSVAPRRTTAERPKVYVQMEKHIRSRSKNKKCARIGYQTAMGIYIALMQIQWQNPRNISQA